MLTPIFPSPLFPAAVSIKKDMPLEYELTKLLIKGKALREP
jgi:hypothetical protein